MVEDANGQIITNFKEFKKRCKVYIETLDNREVNIQDTVEDIP